MAKFVVSSSGFLEIHWSLGLKGAHPLLGVTRHAAIGSAWSGDVLVAITIPATGASQPQGSIKRDTRLRRSSASPAAKKKNERQAQAQ